MSDLAPRIVGAYVVVAHTALLISYSELIQMVIAKQLKDAFDMMVRRRSLGAMPL